MHRYLTEFIGTFFLVLTIGLTAVNGSMAAPLAIGLVLMVVVYMGGHVSGAHYNPAITLALYLRGTHEGSQILPYMAAQVLGAWVAAGAVLILTGSTFAPVPGSEASVMAVLLSEILLTFALALVIMNVATSKKTEGNQYFGLAIGLTVTAGAYSVGPISGGAFNPAVGIGPIMVDTLAGDGSFGNLWFYLAGPLVGAACAVPVFKLQEAGE